MSDIKKIWAPDHNDFCLGSLVKHIAKDYAFDATCEIVKIIAKTIKEANEPKSVMISSVFRENERSSHDYLCYTDRIKVLDNILDAVIIASKICDVDHKQRILMVKILEKHFNEYQADILDRLTFPKCFRLYDMLLRLWLD